MNRKWISTFKTKQRCPHHPLPPFSLGDSSRPACLARLQAKLFFSIMGHAGSNRTLQDRESITGICRGNNRLRRTTKTKEETHHHQANSTSGLSSFEQKTSFQRTSEFGWGSKTYSTDKLTSAWFPLSRSIDIVIIIGGALSGVVKWSLVGVYSCNGKKNWMGASLFFRTFFFLILFLLLRARGFSFFHFLERWWADGARMVVVDGPCVKRTDGPCSPLYYI